LKYPKKLATITIYLFIKNFSASRAALQPLAAAVMAWR
jgi:hypothetical protein